MNQLETNLKLIKSWCDRMNDQYLWQAVQRAWKDDPDFVTGYLKWEIECELRYSSTPKAV